MCVIEDQFVMWKEILDIFSRFSRCEFSFLNGYKARFVCWIISCRLGSAVFSDDIFHDII